MAFGGVMNNRFLLFLCQKREGVFVYWLWRKAFLLGVQSFFFFFFNFFFFFFFFFFIFYF